MKIKVYLIIFSVVLALFFVSYKLSYSFFSDQASTSSNTFSAADVFITPTPRPMADHVVISEIQIKGANANEDFVELYNPTGSSIDLSGWQIKKKNSAGSEDSLVLIDSGIIPGYGYYLWASSDGNPPFNEVIGADISRKSDLKENYSIKLEDAADNTVDQVAWGNGTDQFLEGTAIDNGSATYQSMERKALPTSTRETMEGGADAAKGNGYDSGNNSNDFILRLASDPQSSISSTETP